MCFASASAKGRMHAILDCGRKWSSPAPPPPTAGEEAESSDPGKEKRKLLRRLETALNTLRTNLEKKSNDEVADDDSLWKTLENVVSAKKSYMHHRDRGPWRAV